MSQLGKKGTEKPTESTSTMGQTNRRFTDEERAAMKERSQELKTAARRGPRADKADGEGDVRAKIARCRSRIAPWRSVSMTSSK